MLPTLSGRIQTRIFLLAVVGSIWTLIITPVLPLGDIPIGTAYRTTFTVLALTTVLIVLLGSLLPYSPLAETLGFIPLPPGFFLFLSGVINTYLLLVEGVKRRLMRHLLA